LSNIGGVDHADATATMLARTASIARSRRGLAILKRKTLILLGSAPSLKGA
jgi:hypothetical protein